MATDAYRLLSLRFAVDSDDPAIGDMVRGILAPFRTDEAPEKRFAFVNGGERVSLRLDDEVLVDSGVPSWAYTTFLTTLNRQVESSSSRDYLLLHGGCAADGERAVVLSGASEAGKSTLVTALVRAGLSYVTDEFVAVGDDGLITPVPKHLALDHGSWRLYPELEDHLPHPDATRLSPSQWQIPVQRWAPDRVARHPVRPLLIVFIRYSPDAEFAPAARPRADALLALARQTFGWIDNPGVALRRLAAILPAVDCVDLSYPASEPAVDWILERLTKQV